MAETAPENFREGFLVAMLYREIPRKAQSLASGLQPSQEFRLISPGLNGRIEAKPLTKDVVSDANVASQQIAAGQNGSRAIRENPGLQPKRSHLIVAPGQARRPRCALIFSSKHVQPRMPFKRREKSLQKSAVRKNAIVIEKKYQLTCGRFDPPIPGGIHTPGPFQENSDRRGRKQLPDRRGITASVQNDDHFKTIARKILGETRIQARAQCSGTAQRGNHD